MEIGAVRVADVEDFKAFRRLADGVEGWSKKYDKNGIKVWLQSSFDPETRIRLMKVNKVLHDVSAATTYDVLHDAIYRKKWDRTMVEGFELCKVNWTNDISYYQMKCPPPLKNRDFVMQRTWLDTGMEYFIFNHSIFHKKIPPRKGVIRGHSYLTGYLVRPRGTNACEITYVTKSDPKGSIPTWAINKLAHILAPKVVDRLHQACRDYPKWKSKHDPRYKPWLYPEQMSLPPLDPNDLLSKEECISDNSLDESDLKEEDFKDSELQDGDF
jgi:hypothetical protein